MAPGHSPFFLFKEASQGFAFIGSELSYSTVNLSLWVAAVKMVRIAPMPSQDST